MSRIHLPPRRVTVGDLKLIPRLRQVGVKRPDLCLRAARAAGLPVNVAASFLLQESNGGENEFGHDRDAAGDLIFPARPGIVQVTKKLYLAYKQRRGPKGEGGMQGCGPMQLTYWSIQDEADRKGGCWKPLVNMKVGFDRAARSIERHGWHDGIALYNGSGPAAEAYANRVLERAQRIAKTLHPKWEPTAPFDSIAGTHFTWGEVTRRSGYAKLPARLKPGAKRHARNLERLRAAVNAERHRRGLHPTGIRVLSWARSPAKNRAVGGARFSQHLFAVATDLEREEVRRLCPWGGFDGIADRVFARGGFGTYPGGNRHVDSRGIRARWSTWTPGR